MTINWAKFESQDEPEGYDEDWWNEFESAPSFVEPAIEEPSSELSLYQRFKNYITPTEPIIREPFIEEEMTPEQILATEIGEEIGPPIAIALEIPLRLPREPGIYPAPPETIIDKVSNLIRNITKASKDRASVTLALAEHHKISPSQAEEEYEALTADVPGQPSSMELYTGLLTLPIVAGLMSNPLATIAALAGFMALGEAESFIISKVKNKPYMFGDQRGLVDLAPGDINERTKFVLDAIDFIGKGAVLGGGYSKLRKTEWYRRMNNRERGLVALNIAEMERAGYEPKDIIRVLKQRGDKEFEAYAEKKAYTTIAKIKAEEAARGEVPPTEVPIEPIIPREPIKPPPPAKKKPPTKVAERLKVAIEKERELSPLELLRQREVAIKRKEPEILAIERKPEEILRAKLEEEPKLPPKEPKIVPPVKAKPEEVGEVIPEAKEVKEPWEMSLEEYSRKQYSEQQEKIKALERASEEAFNKAEEITGVKGLRQNEQYRKEGMRLKEQIEKESKKLLRGESYYRNKHQKAIQQAISEGKITSHPDYPELGKVEKEPAPITHEEFAKDHVKDWSDAELERRLSAYTKGKDIEAAQVVQAELDRRFPKKVEKEAPAKKVKIKAPKVVKDRSFVHDLIAEGGIWDPSLPGEIRDLITGFTAAGKLKRAKGVPIGLLSKKTGRGIDERLSDMVYRGYLIKDVGEFLELLEKDIKAIAEKKPENRVRPTDIDEAAEDVKFEEGLIENARQELRREGLSDQEVERTLKEGRDIAENISEDQLQKNHEELKTFFEEAPFELKPTEPTPEEKIAIAKERGEIVAPEKEKKRAVIPTEKIPVATKGEQVSLLPPVAGEQVTIEGKIEEKKKQQEKDTVDLFSGIPFHKFDKEVIDPLKKLYMRHIGDPLWNFLTETLPVKAGKKSKFVDYINKQTWVFGFRPEYRKDPKFIDLRDDVQMRIQQYRERAKELAEVMAKFPRAEQIRIAQIIKGGVTATPKRYEAAFETIQRFQELEKDLHKLGILGPDNRFRQLNRKEIAAKFKEIEELEKQIQKFKVKIAKLPKMPPGIKVRVKASINKDIKALGDKQAAILERIRLHYQMSGKLYLRRAYEKIEAEKKFMNRLLSHLRIRRPRLIKGYEKRRKDLRKEYRKYLGEIEQAPFLAYKGLSEESHDVELMKMFVEISRNKKWAISPEEWANIQAVKSRRHLIERYENFKPLPVTEKLGPLFGSLVDPYIWDDLNQSVEIRSDILKAYEGLLALWKTGKVVYNPATQARNIISNAILADFADLPPWRIDIYAKAARDFATKSGYWLEATQKTPLLGKEWAATEAIEFLKVTATLKEGNLATKGANLIAKYLDKPKTLYQFWEQFFKLAIYTNERMKGVDIKPAYKKAEKYIFNYREIPPTVRWAKRWYSPFITFSYKALPLVAQTAVRKPWKLAKYLILMAAVEEITRRMMGESKEEVEREKRVLPDYMRKSIFPGQLSHLRIPYKDKYGRSKYLDLSYILPWGDVAEQWGQSHLVGRPFLPTHPLWVVIAEIGFNEILFTGQDLTIKDLDEGSDYWKKIGTQLWRQAMPSLAGSYSYNKIMSAMKGERDWAGRDRSIEEAIFDVFFGLKIRSIDYYEELDRRISELERHKNELKKRFRRDYRKIIINPTPDRDRDERRQRKLLEKLNTDIERIINKTLELQK